MQFFKFENQLINELQLFWSKEIFVLYKNNGDIVGAEFFEGFTVVILSGVSLNHHAFRRGVDAKVAGTIQSQNGCSGNNSYYNPWVRLAPQQNFTHRYTSSQNQRRMKKSMVFHTEMTTPFVSTIVCYIPIVRVSRKEYIVP